jgi:hypothetical protein
MDFAKAGLQGKSFACRPAPFLNRKGTEEDIRREVENGGRP